MMSSRLLATTPLSPEASRVAAWGALVIVCLTMLGAGYLGYALIKRGSGKLRVKILLGMVMSDALLGFFGFITVVMYLSGHPLLSGKASCNFFGFCLTAILFTQHLWTLVIAIATFALLRYPLSNVTTLLEKYWLILPVLIPGISLVHSGVWYHYQGFSSSGYLCYYASQKDGSQLAKDLIQFIPRAFVFLVVIILYAGLFKFLRRPDTIQASSLAESTGYFVASTPGEESSDIPKKTFAQYGIHTAELGEEGSLPLQDVEDEMPPWERLKIADLDGALSTGISAPSIEHTKSVSLGSPKHLPLSLPPIASEDTSVSPSKSTTTSRKEATPAMLTEMDRSESGASTSDQTMVPSSLWGRTRESDATFRTGMGTPSGEDMKRVPTPSVTGSLKASNLDHGEGQYSSDDMDSLSSHPHQQQTLQQFFAQYQLTPDEIDVERRRNDKTREVNHKEQSASSYFNRQASLLMLYFPIAYLIVFTFSLVRLIYDMSTSKHNTFLTIISLWTVLSVGLVDALVYGLVEFLVRRKVRRKMPEKFESVVEGNEPMA